MKVLATSLGLLILLIFGCHSANRRSQIDRQTEWAYQLIEQGHYSSAIDLFQNLIRQADSPTLRIGLASAYAGRAGVRVQSYWDLAMPTPNSEPPKSFESTVLMQKQWQLQIRSVPPEWREQIAPRAEEIFSLHHRLETLRWRFEQIPLIKSPLQKEDIIAARAAIQNVTSRGTRLYRALLTLVLFRYEAGQVVLRLQEGIENPQSWPCADSFRIWMQQLPPTLELVSDALRDLTLAFPMRAHEFEPMEREFAQQRSTLFTSLSVVEKALCPAQ